MLQQIWNNLHSYLDGGALLLIAGLLLTLKLKNIKIGKLTVDKILSDTKAKEQELDSQIDATETQMDKIRKEYEDAARNYNSSFTDND